MVIAGLSIVIGRDFIEYHQQWVTRDEPFG